MEVEKGLVRVEDFPSGLGGGQRPYAGAIMGDPGATVWFIPCKRESLLMGSGTIGC